MNKSARLNRLFAADGKCFVVALDHGTVNEARFLSSIENIHKMIAAVAAANPDAILLNPGAASTLQSIPGKAKPSLVLRTDIPNIYHKIAPSVLFDQLIDAPVEQALRFDAACVIANLFLIAEQPQIHQQCLQNISRLKTECDRYAMPMMVEVRVMELNRKGGYTPSGDADKLVPLCRQAIELGTDILKPDPTDDPKDFHRIIEAAGDRPVLALGGGKVAEEQILARTHVLMQQGARGVVYGRNVFEHPNPAGMIRAVMAIVHEGATSRKALSSLRARK
jgi:DhnA family fructose-bisphosphate aldolase class Ia